jgi:hypothetical protein
VRVTKSVSGFRSWLIHHQVLCGPRLGLLQCVGEALATEAIAERIRGAGVEEPESDIDLLLRRLRDGSQTDDIYGGRKKGASS